MRKAESLVSVNMYFSPRSWIAQLPEVNAEMIQYFRERMYAMWPHASPGYGRRLAATG
jgi:hypothetical protein